MNSIGSRRLHGSRRLLTLKLLLIPDHATAVVDKETMKYCMSNSSNCAIEQESCILMLHQTHGIPLILRRGTG